MVGVSPHTGKHSHHATARHSQATSRGLKSHKSNNNKCHASQCSLASRSCDTNTSLSLKVSNWRVRHSDDSNGGSCSGAMHLDDDITSSTLSSDPKFSSFRTCSVRRQSSAGKAVPTLHHAAEKPASIDCLANASQFLRGPLALANSSDFFFEVMRHMKIFEGEKGQTVNIFEIRKPCQDSSNSSAVESRCQLTPVNYSADHSSEKEFAYIESQRDQLIAALRAADATPGRAVGSSFSSYAEALQSLPSRTDSASFIEKRLLSEERSGKAVPRVSNPLSFLKDYQESELREKDATSATSNSHAADTATQREEKFKLLITRLNQNFCREEGSEKEKFDGHCKAEARPKDVQHSDEAEPNLETQLRHPIHGIGRRYKTESDFAVQYLPGSITHSRAGLSSSERESIGGLDKSNTLNPKAREFLSFSKASSGAFCAPRRPLLRPYEFSVKDCNLNRAGCRSDFTEAEMPKSTVDEQTLIPASSAELPLRCQSNSCATDVMTNSISLTPAALGLVPVTMDTYKPSLTRAFAWPSTQSTANIVDETADCHPKTFIPLLTSIPALTGISCLSATCGSGCAREPVATAATIPPRPVPKPKNPNPKSQQEYEAWVEWRKANEPGYAMACKLRQQRRAQRNAAQQGKPGRNKKCE